VSAKCPQPYDDILEVLIAERVERPRRAVWVYRAQTCRGGLAWAQQMASRRVSLLRLSARPHLLKESSRRLSTSSSGRFHGCSVEAILASLEHNCRQGDEFRMLSCAALATREITGNRP